MEVTGANNVLFTGGTYTYTTVHRHSVSEHQGFAQLQNEVVSEALHNAHERIGFPRYRGDSATLKNLNSWINTPRIHKPPIMWLTSTTTAEISTVAQTIAEQCHSTNLLLASFFFPRSQEADTNARSLFATIACQIATNMPNTKPFISQAIELNPVIFKLDSEAQIRKLIMEPLRASKYDLSMYPSLVIIEGLIKCSESIQRDIIVSIANSLRAHPDIPLTFLIASHRQGTLTTIFESVELRWITTTLAVENEALNSVDIDHVQNAMERLAMLRDEFMPTMPHVHPGYTNNPVIRPPRPPSNIPRPTRRIPISDPLLPTKRGPYKPPLKLQNTSTITCSKLSSDGQKLLVGLANGTIAVWNTSSTRSPKEYHCSNGMITAVALSPWRSAKYLAVASSPNGTSIHVILKDGSSVCVAKKLPLILHIFIISNGTIVALFCLQGKVLLKVWRVVKHGQTIWDKGVTLTDLPSLAVHPPDIFYGCAFLDLPKQKIFYIVTRTGLIFSLDIENGHQIADNMELEVHNRISVSSTRTSAGHSSSTTSHRSVERTASNDATVGQSSNGDRFVSDITLEPRETTGIHLAATLLQTPASSPLPQHPFAASEPEPHIRLASCPEQRKLALSFPSGQIFLWDISLRHVKIMREASSRTPGSADQQSQSRERRTASPISFSTDGKYLLYVCNEQEKTIKIQDVATTIISDSIFLKECPDDGEIVFITALKDFKHIFLSFRHCTYSMMFKWR